MTEQSELERDAERVRAQIADTAEHLKDKMSPGQLMDEVVNYFKGSGDGSQFLGNLKLQVRDNPLALALVGSGLAWLMMGSGPGGEKGHSPRNPLAGNDARPVVRTPDVNTPASPSDSADASSGLGEKAAALSDKVSNVAGAVTGAATRTLHDLQDGAASGLGQASHAGSDAARRAKASFLDALDREPLVLGALGVAVGAAIGAMLPPTKLEREYIGDTSSKVRDAAEGLVADGIDKAKEVASDVYAAARDEADNQGLVSEGNALTDKVGAVAKAAGEELKAAAADTLDRVGSAANSASDRHSPDNDQA